MPNWLGVWCDEFPRFRTAIPFFFLSILVICVERNFFKYLVINCALVILVELSQLLILQDIAMYMTCFGDVVVLLLGWCWSFITSFYIFKSKQTHN
jgi:hypothetical protein